MPTFVHGKSTDFELDDTSGTSRSLANTLTSVDFPEVIDTADVSALIVVVDILTKLPPPLAVSSFLTLLW